MGWGDGWQGYDNIRSNNSNFEMQWTDKMGAQMNIVKRGKKQANTFSITERTFKCHGI